MILIYIMIATFVINILAFRCLKEYEHLSKGESRFFFFASLFPLFSQGLMFGNFCLLVGRLEIFTKLDKLILKIIGYKE